MPNLSQLYDDTESFGEGPFYTEYLYKLQETQPTLGLEAVSWDASLSNLYALKANIIEHFNTKYHFREIGSETEERFQYMIGRVYDNIKRVYNHRLQIYANTNLIDLGNKRTLQDNREIDENGNIRETKDISNSDTTQRNATSKDKNVFQDTPITELIATHNYATNQTENEAQSQDSSTNNGLINQSGNVSDTKNTRDRLIREETILDRSPIVLATENNEMWRDLIDDFVDEFRVCFINEVTRI